MLIDLVKNRILNDTIKLVKDNLEFGEAFCCLVVDDMTLPIVSKAMQYYDIIEAGVAVVQLIYKNREPLPQLEAIYYLEPTTMNIKKIIEDMKHEKKLKYSAVHIFWATPICQNKSGLIEITKAKTLLSHIKSFVDINLDFIAYDSNTFNLRRIKDCLKFYEKDFDDDSFLEEIVTKLSTIVSTLQAKPIIRFYNQGINKDLNKKVAIMLEKHIMEYIPLLTESKNEVEIIIIDRSIDIACMFIHEYTYQALAYDVLNISIDNCDDTEGKKSYDTYSYKDRKNNTKFFSIGEHDELFRKYQNQHITSVINNLNSELSSFSIENATAKYTNQQNDAFIASAINELPEYREMLTSFGNHLKLADDCLETIKKKGIFIAGKLEQDLATGVDSNGKSVNTLKLLEDLAKLLSNSGLLGNDVKVRLLLLYFFFMNGVQEEDKAKIIKSGGLSLEFVEILQYFLSLRIGLNTSSITSNSIKHSHMFANKSDIKQIYKNHAKKSDFQLTRYVPTIKEYLQQIAMDTLSVVSFPYLRDPNEKTDLSVLNASRLNANQMEWDWGVIDKKKKNRKKTKLVFMLGPLFMSEMRSRLEVSKNYDCELLVGGLCIATPSIIINYFKRALSKIQ